MNFTGDIKKEIIHRSERWSESEKRAALSAFFRTSGTLGVQDGTPTFFLVSETEMVAERFMQIFADLFGVELVVSHATMDRMSGRDKLVLSCPLLTSQTALQRLGLWQESKVDFRQGVLPSLVKTEDDQIAYIQGAFLGGGSCNTPKNGAGYHLELVFIEKKTAQNVRRILDELGVFAKLITRKETYVLYIKSKEIISDFLAICGADGALKKFGAILEERDVANQNNRARNCFSGNADKTAIASVKQVMAIQKLTDNNALSDLSEDLRLLARTRLAYPEMNLRELAEKLNVSKSCLNHRMRKLMQIADELED